MVRFVVPTVVVATFSVGVACHVQAAAQSVFDKPVDVSVIDLPADPANPDARRQINCYRYQDFTVKQVDYGEKGAQKLAVQAADADCIEDDPGERIPADLEGYFLGAKGNFLFFSASDGWNGGLPFYVYDAQSLKLLFEDSFEGEGLESAMVGNGKLTLEFRRSYSASCSLYLDGTNCATQIKQAVPGLGGAAALPDCGLSYEAEKQRTPDYAKEIEALPSVISHQAKLVFDGKTTSVVALAGPTVCRPPD